MAYGKKMNYSCIDHILYQHHLLNTIFYFCKPPNLRTTSQIASFSLNFSLAFENNFLGLFPFPNICFTIQASFVFCIWANMSMNIFSSGHFYTQSKFLQCLFIDNPLLYYSHLSNPNI